MVNKITIALLLALFSLMPMGAQKSFAEDNCTASYGSGANRFSLATGSPGELGLLKVLGETFGKEADATLCWVKAGSGESMQLLKDKKVDMIMVHAPAAEKKAVADGWAANRQLIGSNEFFIVGPAADPAGIARQKTAVDAYAAIAKTRKSSFPAATTQEPIKRKWTSGNRPPLPLPANGMW